MYPLGMLSQVDPKAGVVHRHKPIRVERASAFMRVVSRLSEEQAKDIKMAAGKKIRLETNLIEKEMQKENG